MGRFSLWKHCVMGELGSGNETCFGVTLELSELKFEKFLRYLGWMFVELLKQSSGVFRRNVFERLLWDFLKNI